MSIRGYYPSFVLPRGLPPEFEKVSRKLWDATYPALYEAAAGASLDEAIALSLGLLGDPAGDDRAWRRFGFAARSLALAARETVLAHRPGDPAPDQVIAALDKTSETVSLPSEVTPPQALNDAYGVLRQALVVRDRARARAALSSMLEDCLEGYAIVPGSAGRRDLFNWWLIEVLPAAWFEKVAPKIYTLHWKWPPPS